MYSYKWTATYHSLYSSARVATDSGDTWAAGRAERARSEADGGPQSAHPLPLVGALAGALCMVTRQEADPGAGDAQLLRVVLGGISASFSSSHG